jgi:hypothetical protein
VSDDSTGRQPAVLDPGLGTDAATAAGEATMTDVQKRAGLWVGTWLIAATLVLLLVAAVVGIMLLVQIVRTEGLLS